MSFPRYPARLPVASAMPVRSVELWRGQTVEEVLGNLAVAGEFRRRFEAEIGDIGCRELAGLDLSAGEDLTQLMNSDVPQKVCFPAVGAAYRVVAHAPVGLDKVSSLRYHIPISPSVIV